MPETKSSYRPWIVLVALYLALRLPALHAYAPTYDEPIYLGAGQHWAVMRDARAAAMLYHPPLSYHLTSSLLWFLDTPLPAWNPAGFGSQVGIDVLYGSHSGGAPVHAFTVLFLARLPVLLAGLLGLVLTKRIAERLGGVRAGWLAAATWAAYPEAVSQSVQATTDLVAAIACLFLAWTAIRHFDACATQGGAPRRTHLALGAACGLAAMAKHTLLVPIAIVALAAIALRWRSRSAAAPHPVRRFLAAAAVAFAVLWAGYLFEFGTLSTHGGGGHEHSATIARWTHADPATVDRWLENVAVPMPTYLRSVADAFLDKARARTGTTWTGYLCGDWNDAGFLSYFPIALVVKTPVSLLALIALGLAGWWTLRRSAGVAADLCLALFVLPFLAAVASRLNIGVRHLLPAVPFALCLGCAAFALWWERHRTAGNVAAALLGAALASEWAVNRLDPLPFANVASGGPARLHERLADSNLEMGQDLWQVERWCERHGVTSIHVLVHDPQGLYEREAAAHGYLRPRDDMNPTTFADAVMRTAQTGDVPPTGLLALGESVMVRPLGWARLAGVEPLARIGRTRIYRTTN